MKASQETRSANADSITQKEADKVLAGAKEMVEETSAGIINAANEAMMADESGDLDFFFHTCIEPYVGRSDDVQVRCV